MSPAGHAVAASWCVCPSSLMPSRHAASVGEGCGQLVVVEGWTDGGPHEPVVDWVWPGELICVQTTAVSHHWHLSARKLSSLKTLTVLLFLSSLAAVCPPVLGYNVGRASRTVLHDLCVAFQFEFWISRGGWDDDVMLSAIFLVTSYVLSQPWAMLKIHPAIAHHAGDQFLPAVASSVGSSCVGLPANNKLLPAAELVAGC